MGTAKDLIQQCENLQTLPEASLRVQQIVNDPEGAMRDLTKVISMVSMQKFKTPRLFQRNRSQFSPLRKEHPHT